MTDLVSRVAQWVVPALGELEESRGRGVSVLTAFRYDPFAAGYSLFNGAFLAGGTAFLGYATARYPEMLLPNVALTSWLLVTSHSAGRIVSEAAVWSERRAGWWRGVIERDRERNYHL